MFLLRRRARARAGGGGQCAGRREHHSRDGVGESRSSVGGVNGHNPGQGSRGQMRWMNCVEKTVLGLTEMAGEVGDGQGQPSDATGQSLEPPESGPRRKDWRCLGSVWNVMWGPVDECVLSGSLAFALFLCRGRLSGLRGGCAGLSVLDSPTRGPYDAMNKRSTGRQLANEIRVAGEAHCSARSLRACIPKSRGRRRHASGIASV